MQHVPAVQLYALASADCSTPVYGFSLYAHTRVYTTRDGRETSASAIAFSVLALLLDDFFPPRNTQNADWI